MPAKQPVKNRNHQQDRSKPILPAVIPVIFNGSRDFAGRLISAIHAGITLVK